MKYIISESQKEYVWLIRRLDEPKIIAHFEDILSEGIMDVTDGICEYNFEGGKKEFIHDMLQGSVYTFILSYEDDIVYDAIEKKEWYKDLFNYLYDKMFGKYGPKLSSFYDDHMEDCPPI